MRSEFEKWLGDVWLSDAEWDESKNTYSDSRIHCMWSAWQHQQSKVDELTKQRDSFIKAYQIEMDESVELQKRVDAAFRVLSQLNALDDEAHKRWKREACMFSQGESNAYEHAVRLLEQVINGGEA